ncbi:hypothetical protein JAAARDRAFT_204766 [Jaapia argillacea MUCL 33604]|uniref:Chromo domain-containing protein n=1 Tax=Jaapia argillacea MUCL 33604 TaxID=933084 RepID=A0A067Q213_9AGAM|nr:hypothetical protein JAAARDRAFT_204766 [Jaapia argillacea MUCL 33604]
MSDSEPPEYEVESIVSARVESRRGKKITWKYCVKWKGFGIADNTYEPAESFEGSEHFIDTFWSKVDTGGRDINDASLWKSKEEVLPHGPPRRRKSKVFKSKEVRDDTPTAPPVASSSRVPTHQSPEDVDEDDEQPSRHKKRAAASSPSHGTDPPRVKRKRMASPDAEPPIITPTRTSARFKPSESSSKTATSSPSPTKALTQGKGKGRRLFSPGPLLSATPLKGKALRRSPSSIVPSSAPEECDSGEEATMPSAPDSSKPDVQDNDEPVGDGDMMQEDEKQESGPVAEADVFGDGGVPMDDEAHNPETNEGQPSLTSQAKPVFQLAAPTQSGSSPNPAPISSTSRSHSSQRSSTPQKPPSTFGFQPQPTISPVRPVVPSHRAREANPRVKPIDDSTPGQHASAINAKARILAGPNGPVAGTSGSGGPRGRIQAGARKSSLLTFQKGVLKTTPGSFGKAGGSASAGGSVAVDQSTGLGGGTSADAEDLFGDEGLGDELDDGDHISGLNGAASSELAPPPTAEELLKMAGLNSEDAGALADFEEEEAPSGDVAVMEAGSSPAAAAGSSAAEIANVPPAEGSSTTSAIQKPSQSLLDTMSSLFNKSSVFSTVSVTTTAASEPSGSVLTGLHSVLRRSTIFGPLSSIPSPAKFFLGFTPEIQVPVIFKEVVSDPSSALDPLDKLTTGQRGTPGKVYPGSTLIHVLGSTGAFARVEVEADADESQYHYFDQFLKHLKSDGVFIQMAGSRVIAFFASENKLVTEQLAIPQGLRGLPETVVAAHVFVKDYTAYLDVSEKPMEVQWS